MEDDAKSGAANRLRPGDPFNYYTTDVKRGKREIGVEGEIIEVIPERKLVHSFAPLKVDPGRTEAPSRVSYELEEQANDTVKLTVIHEGFAGETPIFRQAAEGWPIILSGLKTLLETGRLAERGRLTRDVPARWKIEKPIAIHSRKRNQRRLYHERQSIQNRRRCTAGINRRGGDFRAFSKPCADFVRVQSDRTAGVFPTSPSAVTTRWPILPKRKPSGVTKLFNIAGRTPTGTSRRTNIASYSRRRRRSTPPAFGGYCAFAVSQGLVVGADPKVWKIVDGRLFVNNNPDAAETWKKDINANIATGDTNWAAR